MKLIFGLCSVGFMATVLNLTSTVDDHYTFRWFAALLLVGVSVAIMTYVVSEVNERGSR